jgi:anti-anti-sigma regulatory factor
MKLSLLPLQNDNVLRVRCEGMLTLRGQEGTADPLQTLLGPHCSSHKVLLNLERAQGTETSGISWLMRTNDRFAQSRGMLVLYAVPPVVGDILDFLRLTPLLHVAPGEAAALDMALADGEPLARKLPPTEEKSFGKSLRLPG